MRNRASSNPPYNRSLEPMADCIPRPNLCRLPRWFHVEGEPLRLAASAHHLVHLGHRWILPAIYPQADYVESGGLMSYGPDRAEPLRRAAFYVDKMLKGTKPANLPVEQPTKFEAVSATQRTG
jgi:ABC transporter substrate binding protein